MRYEQLRQRCRERREELGLNQREVAVRMRTGQSVVSGLETGQIQHPRVDTLRRWTDAVELDLDFDVTETLVQVET